MGYVSTEQVSEVIRTTGEAIERNQSHQNYWWLLLIAIVPVIVGAILAKKWKK